MRKNKQEQVDMKQNDYLDYYIVYCENKITKQNRKKTHDRSLYLQGVEADCTSPKPT